MTLTLSYDDTLSRVQIEVTDIDGSVTEVMVERSADQVTWSTVRGAAAVPVVSGEAVAWDYEFYPDVPTYYRVTAGEDVESDHITVMLDQVWLKSIQRPFLNRAVVPYGAPPEPERIARTGIHDVVGRMHPVAVTDVLLAPRWTLDLITRTPEDWRTLDLILASGDTLLIQAPTSGRLASVPTGYAVATGVRRRHLPTASLDEVVTSVSLQEVAAPDAEVVGATVTCAMVLATYPTCDDVLAAHPTCVSLLTLIGDPTDVIVDNV